MAGFAPAGTEQKEVEVVEEEGREVEEAGRVHLKLDVPAPKELTLGVVVSHVSEFMSEDPVRGIHWVEHL